MEPGLTSDCLRNSLHGVLVLDLLLPGSRFHPLFLHHSNLCQLAHCRHSRLGQGLLVHVYVLLQGQIFHFFLYIEDAPFLGKHIMGQLNYRLGLLVDALESQAAASGTLLLD
jgi:hypothetical protein